MLQAMTVFVAGLVFAAGLVLGGMTQPQKIIGFLDVTGNWDPSLAFVMLGAVGLHAVAYRLIVRRSRPLFSDRFLVPKRSDLDRPLVLGALLFGIGWGLGGYCPGPALVATGAGVPDAAIFVAALMGGHWLFGRFHRWSHRRAAQGTPKATESRVAQGT